MADGDTITRDELLRRFPDGELPMWAVSIIFDSPQEWTVNEVRKKLDDEIAARAALAKKEIRK